VALAVKALSQFARVSTSVGYAHAEHPSSRKLLWRTTYQSVEDV
jgi:hypothetical protein